MAGIGWGGYAPATPAPAAPSGFSSSAPTPGSTVPRPAAMTWQDSEYQNAQDLWNSQAAGIYGQEASALAGQNYAVGQSGAALARLSALNPTNLAAYSPSELAGYNPSAALTGPSGSASALAGTYASGAGGGISDPTKTGPAAFADAKAAAKAVSDFDPTTYGTTFAQGAESEFTTDVQTQLDQLERNSAGTGRLETGFYTGDQGTVVTNLGKDFNSKIAQAATTFSGQRLQALQGGASALTSVDQDIAAAGQAAQNEIDYTNLTREQQTISAKLAEEGMSVAEQQQAASLGLSQAQMLSQLRLTQAQGLDSFNLSKTNSGLQGALAEEQMARSSYNSAASAAGAYTSATRDWAAQDKETQDQIDFETALAKYLQGLGGQPTAPGGPVSPKNTSTGGSGANQTDPYAWLREEAKELGVPFSG